MYNKTCDTLEDIIILHHLYNSDGNMTPDFNLSSRLELKVTSAIAKTLNICQSLVDVTTGYNHSYDSSIGEVLFEFKASSSKNLSIELSKKNLKPGGLDSSNSHYYVFINPGYLSKLNREVMKIRVIRTSILKKQIQQKPYQFQDANYKDSNAKTVNPKNLGDDLIYIGYMPIVSVGPLSFNLNNITFTPQVNKIYDLIKYSKKS